MITRRYTHGDVTVVWQPAKCMHSGICFAGLHRVFDPRRRPWVDLAQASTAEIVAQVKECPSGALSLADGPDDPDAEPVTGENPLPTVVTVSPHGPILVKGHVIVQLPDGTEQMTDKCALCRCGGSATKPFCDGSHRKNGFTG